MSPGELLDALVLFALGRAKLPAFEPALIAGARATRLSWQALAPTLGPASRQAAERRYLRSVSSALPARLAATRHHLPRHPDLAAQVDTVTAHTDQIRRQPLWRRSDTS